MIPAALKCWREVTDADRVVLSCAAACGGSDLADVDLASAARSRAHRRRHDHRPAAAEATHAGGLSGLPPVGGDLDTHHPTTSPRDALAGGEKSPWRAQADRH